MNEQEKSEFYHTIRKRIYAFFKAQKTKKEISKLLIKKYSSLKTPVQKRIFFVAIMTACIEHAGDLYQQTAMEQAKPFFERIGLKLKDK